MLKTTRSRPLTRVVGEHIETGPMVVKMMDEIREPTTPSKLANQGVGHDANPVQLDHCYAKPWNWRQETAHCKPVKTLFSEDTLLNCAEEPIDVDGESPPTKNQRLIDQNATINSFVDAEQKLNLIMAEETGSDWEETVKREGWTPLQHRIFNKVVKLLVADNMSRLATVNMENEVVQKKILIEGAAKKMRIILSSVAWDIKITQWLHLTLIEHLSRDYLLCYVSILQVLRNKVPTLVDRILNIPLMNASLSGLNNQIFTLVASKPWEPVLASNNQNVLKLPVAPVIVIVPSGTSNSFFSNSHGSKRYQTWHSKLQTIGKVVTVSLPSSPAPHSLPLPSFVESIISATVQKVQESKALFPGRPIVLAGMQQGALVAAQVAHVEPVSALIFLGFPLFCVDGKRGEPDDFILDLKCPTMFVIGQSSSNCTIDGIEQMRYRMRAESYLVVVDGAMDTLHMLKWKKKQQNLTQSMVDSTILDEISTFLTNVLSQAATNCSGKRSPVERKPDSVTSGPSKRLRHSTDPDDGNISALSGHNHTSTASTPFQPPWKGRTGTGLARVRGGRIGPTNNRAQYQRTQSETPSSPGKVRIGRALSAGTYRLQGGSAENTPTKTKLQRQQSSGQSDIDYDGKSSIDSTQSSPKDDLANAANLESRGGGDSSETESAPPADDDDELMEDLRFANELMAKQNSTPHKRDEDNPDDEFSLKSGDEVDDLPLADVCRRLSAENRNRAQARNQAAASPS